MKNKKVFTTKKCSVAFLAAVLSVGMLMGCGKQAVNDVLTDYWQRSVQPNVE